MPQGKAFLIHMKKAGRFKAAGSDCRQTTGEKASQSSRPQARRNSNPSFAGACTWQKTPLSPQVCERLPQASARSGLHPPCIQRPLAFGCSKKPTASQRSVFRPQRIYHTMKSAQMSIAFWIFSQRPAEILLFQQDHFVYFVQNTTCIPSCDLLYYSHKG